MFWNKKNLSMKTIDRACETEAALKEKQWNIKREVNTVKVIDLEWKEIQIAADYWWQLKRFASWEWHRQKYRQDILQKFLLLTQ